MEKNYDLFSHIKMPKDYFKMSEEDKLDVCVGLLESIYDIIIKNSSRQFDKVELFQRVLESTIKHNEQLENYEACAILNDTKRLLDEQTKNK